MVASVLPPSPQPPPSHIFPRCGTQSRNACATWAPAAWLLSYFWQFAAGLKYLRTFFCTVCMFVRTQTYIIYMKHHTLVPVSLESSDTLNLHRLKKRPLQNRSLLLCRPTTSSPLSCSVHQPDSIQKTAILLYWDSMFMQCDACNSRSDDNESINGKSSAIEFLFYWNTFAWSYLLHDIFEETLKGFQTCDNEREDMLKWIFNFYCFIKNHLT